MGNDLFVTPSIPSRQQEFESMNKEPFNLPIANKKEELSAYVALMRPDSSVDFSNFDGVDFSKRIQPTKASLKENEGKHIPDRFQVYMLSEGQVKAVKEAANKRYVTISGKPNPKCGSREDVHNTEPEYLPTERICIGDFIILEKFDSFKPYESAQRKLEEEVKVIIDEGQKLDSAIYKMQEPSSKSSKKN